MFSDKFIAATREYGTLDDHVAAPYLRKTFVVTGQVQQAMITICGLGFYRLFINGREVTKGLLAPYVSNPDHILYYDEYQISKELVPGENVIGILLGNGLLNCPGGRVWKFDQASYRSAPKVALCLEIGYEDGSVTKMEADESFRVHPSPILFDDYRCGEFYDARLELPGWNCPGFDDGDWQPALKAETPLGEPQICKAEPIAVIKQLKPVKIQKGCISRTRYTRTSNIMLSPEEKQGYIYDFGENFAGLVRLRIRGRRGQRLSLQTGEVLDREGNLDISGMRFQPEAYDHRMIYTLRGEGTEEYAASFTFFGMRYCLVSGITEEQATEELLTFEVMSSDLQRIGDVFCSDETVNKLQQAVYRSDVSNFYYFPLDCPHREKNGWTGDASLSAEQMLFNLKAENSFRVWMDNIRKAQKPTGEIPGLVPTAGWGYSDENSAWNGPGWDSVLVNLPFYTWLYRGETEMIRENADCLFRYLQFLADKRDPQGMLELGLWDYVPIRHKMPRTPLVTSSTLIAMDICRKAGKLFAMIGRENEAAFAEKLGESLRQAARIVLLEKDGATVLGRNQSAQAMGLAYGLFEPGERKAALEKLLEYIQVSQGKMDTGVLGARVLFHVLAEAGQAELAYKMIVGPEFPSYGHWVVYEDATTLFESFRHPDSKEMDSRNHHFWGDISSWFFKYIAGVKINPYERDFRELEISPVFLETLKYGGGYHELPAGKVEVYWERKELVYEKRSISGNIQIPMKGILMKVLVPEGCYGYLRLPDGYAVPEEKEHFLVSALRLQPGETVYEIFRLY